ncbi:glycosyltransferase family 4 protein [Oscillatoria amoena NRMC-F 0135]|nr:glycosyltransferase family 4 protein [Oscillatoria amoena NRMC-F 0135]
MMRVLFLNENTLGHASYLPRFASAFAAHPEFGCQIHQLDVCPLPADLEHAAQDPLPLAARFGFSRLYRRWREIASLHAQTLLDQHLTQHPADALVVNTQSVGLTLPTKIPASLPLAVCLDATFAQLRRTPWFYPNRLARLFQHFTVGQLLEQEARLFERANLLLPWSQAAAHSLRDDYGIAPQKIQVLPPSLDLAKFDAAARTSTPTRDAAAPDLPRILFLGGDFRRKGGPLLVECFRKYFAGKATLDIVTQTAAPESPGVRVWKDVPAQSSTWFELWRRADLFVFPSLLETFGIVLLEAHAFRVPVIARATGAAPELLERGAAGWLLERLTENTLRDSIEEALAQPEMRARKAARGRAIVEASFNLPQNCLKLSQHLHALAGLVTRRDLS